MAFEPAARYATVAELQRDIETYQGGFATGAENAGAWKLFTLFVKRHKAASIGVAALLLVSIGFTAKVIAEGKRAERGEAAAKATLADLRRTAPVFYAQAKVDFEEGNFEAAIEKIGYAIQLDDTAADYHLFRANLRESSQDLAAAAEGYRRVLALRPADAAAKTNLALCETLLRESGGATLGHPQQFKLLESLRRQNRLLEAAPLAALIDPDIKLAKAAILARLREVRKRPGWRDERVSAVPDGTFRVELGGFPPMDYSVLKGQPVSVLDLHNTDLADLSSLVGLPLKELNLNGTKVTDLSLLRGMPLENLALGRHLDFSPLADLSPLRGMKLRTLDLKRTEVSDLSPLAGMPLTSLNCSDCKKLSDLSPLQRAPLVELFIESSGVASLAPLAGAPLKRLWMGNTKITDITPLSQFTGLEELHLRGLPISDLTPLANLHLTYLSLANPKVTSIAPLRGQPLRFLDVNKTGVTDLSPLADCDTLEEIVLPEGAADPSMLRGLPRLRLISYKPIGKDRSVHPAQTAAEFWKEYDAKPKPAGK